MIRFSVTRLEKEPIELIGEEPAEWLELGADELVQVDSPVYYDLQIKAVSGGALVEGCAETTLSGNCGRCLEPVKTELRSGRLCLYLELPDADEMDISEEIRAELLLELPMNLLCDDDCKGLCPHCGVNLNTGRCNCSDCGDDDNRWGALDQLKL